MLIKIEPLLYNEERPHESLGNLTPTEFLMKNSPKEVSTFGWPYFGDCYMVSTIDDQRKSLFHGEISCEYHIWNDSISRFVSDSALKEKMSVREHQEKSKRDFGPFDGCPPLPFFAAAPHRFVMLAF